MAVTGNVTMADPNEPLGVLATPGVRGGHTVRWMTRDARQPRVRWGPAPGDYTWGDAPANTSTYGVSDMCGAPANESGWSDPGALHRVALPPAPPGAALHYEVYDAASDAPRAAGSIPGPPPPGGTAHVVLTADVGVAYRDTSVADSWIFPPALNTSLAVAQDLKAGGAGFQGSLLMHVGDISYAMGHAATWDAYLAMLQPAMVRGGGGVVGWRVRGVQGPRGPQRRRPPGPPPACPLPAPPPPPCPSQ